MKYHFEKLKQSSFKNFSDNNSTSDGKYLISKEKNGTSSQIIDKIFLLKEINYKKTSYNKLVNISANNLKVRLSHTFFQPYKIFMTYQLFTIY